MPDFEKILNALLAVLKLIFGDNLPPQIKKWLGIIVFTVFIVLFVWVLLFFLNKIIELAKDKLFPALYKPEEKSRNKRRRQFADHLESEIRRLNNLEAWHDYRFTELEAEVEAEGRRRRWSWVPFYTRTQSGLRREKSLSRALEKSQERLVLLEGEPGSGKSVALRFVAQRLLKRAMNARSNKVVIPIYINLKELEHRKSTKIDRNLIAEFVLQSLNRVNDRDIEEFLEQEFEQGLQKGTWLFLFDSFDEIPEVLSATEANETIKSYGQAISDFLHGMNKCRGVIASRQYRGPGMLGWPSFRILSLKENRREQLIQRASLDSAIQTQLIGQLATANHELRLMASNPMFLGLLCEHVRKGNPFPEHPHAIFETYLSDRLTRDGDKLKRRFKLEPEEVRKTAEKVAFCMTADSGLGLSPTRQDIKAATEKLHLPLGKRFDTLLDALEYIKLGRTETVKATGESKSFTFAHRRFQEYFTTCVVLREPERINPHQLLTDARWRETAVVFCQTQPIEAIAPILAETENMLRQMMDDLPAHVAKSTLRAVSSSQANELATQSDFPELFYWPKHSLHLLGLLQDGFRNRLGELPNQIREIAADIITFANSKGVLTDRKWALEVAGCVPQETLLSLLRAAFNNPSWWLREVAYEQITKLEEVPEDIAKPIRLILLELLISRNFRQDAIVARAHLSRIMKPERLLRNLRLMLWIRPFHLYLLFFASLFLLAALFKRYLPLLHEFMGVSIIFLILIVVAAVPILYLSFITSRGHLEKQRALLFLLKPLFFLLFFIALDWKRYSSAEVFIVSTYLYLLCWLFSAGWLGYTGKYLQVYFWPVFPILAAITLSQSTALWTIKNKRTVLAMIGFVVLLIGATVALAWLFIVSSTIAATVSVFGFNGAEIGMFTLLIAAIIFMARMMIVTSRESRTDWHQWRQFLKGHSNPLSTDLFYDQVTSYQTLSARLRFIRYVRRNDLLSATKETELLLRSLSLLIENEPMLLDLRRTRESRRKILERKASRNGKKTIDAEKITAKLEEELRFHAQRNAELLDELSILIEYVNANRTDL